MILSEREHATQQRRAVIASVIGTTIEWYDFFLYSLASGLVFARLFFPHDDPLSGTLNAFAIYAVGFLARPIGAATPRSVVTGGCAFTPSTPLPSRLVIGRAVPLGKLLCPLGGACAKPGAHPRQLNSPLAAPDPAWPRPGVGAKASARS